MSPLRAALAGMLGLAGVLLAGCGTQAGQAVPAPESRPASAPTESSAAGVPGLPPRPREVSLEGVDPCALLTAEQRMAFGLDAEPVRGTQPSEGDAPTCGLYNNEAGKGVSFIASTRGIGLWFDGSRGGEVTPMTVVGFPAVQIRDESLDPPLCAVAVDVADGQQLIAQNSPSYSNPAPLDERCAETARFAEAAMQTLLAR